MRVKRVGTTTKVMRRKTKGAMRSNNSLISRENKMLIFNRHSRRRSMGVCI